MIIKNKQNIKVYKQNKIVTPISNFAVAVQRHYQDVVHLHQANSIALLRDASQPSVVSL